MGGWDCDCEEPWAWEEGREALYKYTPFNIILNKSTSLTDIRMGESEIHRITHSTHTKATNTVQTHQIKKQIKEKVNTQMHELTQTQMYTYLQFMLPLVSLMLRYAYVSSFVADFFHSKTHNYPLSCFESLLPSSEGATVPLEMKMLHCHSLCMGVFLCGVSMF